MNKIKKGDKVIVITGKDKNKTGVIEKVYPKQNRVIVGGLNMLKKHLKKSAKHPQGGIIDIPGKINISNVMLLDPVKNKPTRVGFVVDKEKNRVSKLSGETIK